MNSYKVVIPSDIHRVTVRRRVMPEAAQEGEVVEELLYDGGFSAGYQAGEWKAAREASEDRASQAADVGAVLHGLQEIQAELLRQAQANIPPLFMATIERVFKNHRITPEELALELSGLLEEVVHAQSISIECCPEELELLQTTLEKLGLMLQKGAHSWKPNPTLQKGEFILQTDLGTVDGRRICKLNKIKAVLRLE